jgi:hypothetical protein
MAFAGIVLVPGSREEDSLMAKQPMRRTIRGGRPYFFADAAVDKVLSMVVTLASEVWALRERVLAMETIGSGRGAFQRGEIDAFDFPPEVAQRLAGERKEFIEGLFRVLNEESTPRAARAKAPAKSVRKPVRQTAKKGRKQ